jgi:NAD+ synthase (glutamine-hydrolysing)
MTFSIRVAQFDAVVGDLAGNARQIVDAAHAARAAGARVLLTPALSVCGPTPGDLVLRPSFITACDDAVKSLARATAALQGLAIVVGHPASEAGQRVHAASVIEGGQVRARSVQRRLPGPAAPHEALHFTPGAGGCVFEVGGVRAGLLVGGDTGDGVEIERLRQAGASWIALLRALPFHAGQARALGSVLAARAQAAGLPMVWVNAVGGHDEWVFAGGARVLGAGGQASGSAPQFEAATLDVLAADATGGAVTLEAPRAPALGADEELWRALVLALRDYVRKNGFERVALGLSGGLDSALVLALAVDALGADAVHTLMMPSPYTADISVEDAHEMARRLGVRHGQIDIAPAFEAFKAMLAPLFDGRPEDTTEENIQARVRGVLLMALSNKLGHLILATGNKSEAAVGYSTLYGDTCGAYAPLADVLKTTAYRLARWRNAHDPFGTGAGPIPERIITRAPSAELREGQTDQDSLPPYEVLDTIIARYVEQGASVAELEAEGLEPELVRRVVRLIHQNQYKRRQEPPGPCVSPRAFGVDWHYPMTHRFRG